MEKINVTVGWDRNYSACLEIGNGIVVATGSSLEKLTEEFTAALRFHLAGMAEDGETPPAQLRGEYQLQFHLNAQALLHYTDGIISRKALAKTTGINPQQLSHYASGWRNPRPEMKQRIADGIRELGHQLISISV